jgi:hypothetical protein
MALKSMMGRISSSNEARCSTNGDVLGDQKMTAVRRPLADLFESEAKKTSCSGIGYVIALW